MTTPIEGLPIFTATLTPTVCENETFGDVAWTNPENGIHATDFATATISAGDESDKLFAHTCDWQQLPPGGIVTGVTINYDRVALLGLLATTKHSMHQVGFPPGQIDDIAVLWTTTIGGVAFIGDDNDWAVELLTNGLRHDDFGVRVWIHNDAPALPTTFQIRAITIDVDYQRPVVATGVFA